ncbi:hypothetical protein JR316_0002667 [Psilocybe cubensis]|uniref:Uncharacterized protein n=2 Tax=Psilocybe cubensis TaxID=181762 RepID=A0ACB8HDL6_PSICU|nr:hypothetical protein JR316_0002667 [Psilocybe cubensis]KAH9485752.1 hypothetical protein JR316_0002667 [Psilocybe cubensis]
MTSPLSHDGLPLELVLAIIDRVEDDEDLLLLARASRLLNQFSLAAFFARNDFDPAPRSLLLGTSDGSMKHLTGLVASLRTNGASLEHLSYDFGFINHTNHLIREVRLLRQFVSKLSTVDRVTLRLATYFTGDPNQWRSESIVLLRTVLQKSCKNIHITTSQLSSFYEEPKTLRSPKPSEWLNNYWPEEVAPFLKESGHLKTCFIQTFPTFLRPFYYHTLKCNASTLTDLSFKNIFGGGSDWATMIANIHFPRLTRLAIIYGVIPRQPLVKFLTKHPNIQELEYHRIRYDPVPKHPARLSSAVFEHLRSLVTTPEHILNFFPSMEKMVALTNLSIKIEEKVTSFSALEGALKCLAGCVNKITLTLEVTRTGLGFGVWLNTIMRTGLNSSGRPECRLQCVETLVMDNGDWGFTDDLILSRLPSWIRLFPALRVLTLKKEASYSALRSHSQSTLDGADSDSDSTLDRLKDACPGIYIEWGP